MESRILLREPAATVAGRVEFQEIAHENLLHRVEELEKELHTTKKELERIQEKQERIMKVLTENGLQLPSPS